MNILVTDPNSKFYFDEKIRNEKTYLGAEDGYNLLRALANNHPEHNYFVMQDTENYCNLKKSGSLDKIFKNHNVIFYTDDILTKYPDIKGHLTKNGHLLNNVKKVIDENDHLADIIDGIICLTVPGNGNISCFSRNADGTFFSNDDEWNKAFYIDTFIQRHPDIPMLAFHVDERFVYQFGKIERTSRIPDLILGFEDRDISVETPKYEYPNGMTSKETVIRKVHSEYGHNDHISLLNFKSEKYPDWKLGSIDNFYKENKKTYPVKIFYNQLRFNYTKDENSPFAFVDRLKTFYDFGMFNEFSPKELQLFTNIKYNDPEIVSKYHSYFNQSLPKNEMINELADQKYTLIISNSKKTSMSQKVWECLSIGVIPFMLHLDNVSEYGSYHYTHEIWDLVPEITIVHSAKEMKERIDYLESHPDYKAKVIKRLMANWNDGFVTGSVVSNALLKGLNKVIKKPINAFEPFSKKIKVTYIDGPKLVGKTTYIKDKIEREHYQPNEFIIIHSDIHSRNDYSYFSDQMDMNFNKDNYIVHYSMYSDPLNIPFENIKEIFIDRGAVSEYIYGELWEMINLGIIKSKDFDLNELDIKLLKHSNIDRFELSLLFNKLYIDKLIFTFNSDCDIRYAIGHSNRSKERLTNYEVETLIPSNNAFRRINRLLKHTNNYCHMIWKK